MTTIAWKDGVLAADSMATDESGAVYVRKSLAMPSGDVAGGAGELNEVTAALCWLAAGSHGDPPGIAGTSILFTVDGQPYIANGGWPGAPIKGCCAIGSGAQGALVAMLRFGASAEEAIAAVSGVDNCTGGEIDVLTVRLKKTPAKARTRGK